VLLLALAGFAWLGAWQVRRMHWKHDLIARVDARVRAAPVELPGDAHLVPAPSDAWDYLRVRLAGVYAGSRTTLVRAATDLGTGYWAMTPMTLADGRTVWINRGFVPEGTTRAAAGASVPPGSVVVVGLLRPSEPGGSLLQSNQPQDERWYSRDVAALSRARETGPTVPEFVDAQQETGGSARGGVVPVPGLTIVRFPDNHLSYALTWFALAGLSALGIGIVWRRASAPMS
jgi:surfeit locus 1 family protein